MKQYYDEFKGFTLDKMAQEMENLTYLYEETHVPKKHYKQHLGTVLEEVISQSVEVNLIDHYLKTMENLKKENAKLFYKAFMCMELGVKPSKITPKERQALDVAYLVTESEKLAYLNPKIKDIYANDTATHVMFIMED